MLVEIAEGVQEGIRPRIAAARGVGDLRDPHRFARFEAVTLAAVEGVAVIRAGEPLLGQRRLGAGLRCRPHRGASDRGRSVKVIGEDVEDRRRVYREKIDGLQHGDAALPHRGQQHCFAHRGGADDAHLRRGLPGELAEDCEVACISGRVVAARGAPIFGHGRLVEELRGHDVAADRLRVVEQLAGLVPRPHAGCVAHSRADGEGSGEARIHRMGEIDDAFHWGRVSTPPKP